MSGGREGEDRIKRQKRRQGKRRRGRREFKPMDKKKRCDESSRGDKKSGEKEKSLSGFGLSAISEHGFVYRRDADHIKRHTCCSAE